MSRPDSWGKNAVFSLLGFLLVVGLLEGVAGLLLLHTPAIDKTRELISGKRRQEVDVNATSQAYLLYIPTPNFTSDQVRQNNWQGYRGEAVTVQREPDTFRVLFLGGSTTYGEGVSRPEDAYPSQVGLLLQHAPTLAGRRIEIINAGLRWGTTAEILTHYLLKFRYYRADLVVINPGGNDPVAYTTPDYQPDYSHWRKTPREVTALPVSSRWLLHSRLASIAIVMLFYSDVVEGSSFVHSGEDTPTKWFVPKKRGQLALDEQAFYNNLSTVVREIRKDSAQVLLLSYQGNPFDQGDQNSWRAYYNHEEKILQRLAHEQSVPFAAFPLSQMPESVWADPSHLNAEGERIKAVYVYQQLLPLLSAAAQAAAPVQAESVEPLALDLPSQYYELP